jgi:ribose-phosphate pyrophosphokinase
VRVKINSSQWKQEKMKDIKDLFVFTGRSNPELAKEITAELNIPIGVMENQRFPDGEIFIKYCQNIRNSHIFLIQPICDPINESLMELLIMIDAAKRASASKITAVIPYYAYARQDRKDQPRVPITAKLVANLLTVAGATRILTMDLHAQQIQGFFDIPVDHLYASPVIVPYLKQKLGDNLVVVSPDSGGVKMAHAYSEMLNAGLAVVSKRRIDATSVESSHLVGDVKDRICIMTDDMTTTTGTLVSAAKLLKEKGAKEIYAAVSHCLLNEIGREKLRNSDIKELITTNGIPVNDNCDGKIKVLSIAKLLARAIKYINQGASVSSLFNIVDGTL